MVLISAGDLIALYLGLELMSPRALRGRASNRDNAKSTEAGLNISCWARCRPACSLYGASLIYGFTGTCQFHRHRGDRQDRQHRHRVRHRVSCSPGSASRSPRCRSTCGRPTSTRARRPGHRVLRLLAQGRCARGVHPRGAHGISRHRHAVAADRGLLSRSPRWRWARSLRSGRPTSSG